MRKEIRIRQCRFLPTAMASCGTSILRTHRWRRISKSAASICYAPSTMCLTSHLKDGEAGTPPSPTRQKSMHLIAETHRIFESVLQDEKRHGRELHDGSLPSKSSRSIPRTCPIKAKTIVRQFPPVKVLWWRATCVVV